MAESGETTVVGADSHFKGELTFERTAKIIGKFEGNISGKGELQISENASCNADVDAAGIQIDGMVKGNLQIKDTVKLNSKGTVKGDILAAKMVMAEGASFYGQCAVGPEALSKSTGAVPQAGAQQQPSQQQQQKK